MNYIIKNKKLQQALIELGFDFKTVINVNYDGMKNTTHQVHEIVGTRVTIKYNGRLIDFHENEVSLYPIAYCEKESLQIQELARKFLINN